jgi:hypothetical protein
VDHAAVEFELDGERKVVWAVEQEIRTRAAEERLFVYLPAAIL